MDRQAVDELMDSIKHHGLISPLVVKPSKKGYEIVAGFRRFTALRRLKYKEAPCRIMNAANLEADIVKLHENIIREDINPIHEADFFRQLLKSYKLTPEKLAKQIGRSKDYVYQRLDVATKDPAIREAIESGLISFTIGRELLRVPKPEQRHRLLDTVSSSGANATTLKGWIDDLENLGWETPIVDTSTGKRRDDSPPPEPTYDCEVCGKPKPVSKTRMVRICGTCAGKVLE